MIYCQSDSLYGQCGGRLLYHFSDQGGSGYTLSEIKQACHGYMLVCTLNQKQKEVYDALCKKFTWLDQSVPIKNPNSGNMIFTVIFKA